MIENSCQELDDSVKTVAIKYADSIEKIKAIKNKDKRMAEERARLLYRTNLMESLFINNSSLLIKCKLFGSLFDDLMNNLSTDPYVTSISTYHPVILLMTGELESRNKDSLSSAQLEIIAHRIKKAGDKFKHLKLYHHAEYSYKLAKQFYFLIDDFFNVDNCDFNQRFCSMKRSRQSISKLFKFFTFLFAGFGYKPYRLLLLALIIILMYGFLFSLFPGINTPFLISSANYLSLGSLCDSSNYIAQIKLISISEAAIALVINSTFLALLVRIWFR